MWVHFVLCWYLAICQSFFSSGILANILTWREGSKITITELELTKTSLMRGPATAPVVFDGIKQFGLDERVHSANNYCICRIFKSLSLEKPRKCSGSLVRSFVSFI